MKALYLVTGGTGSLGRELIPRILRSDPRAEVAVLIRAQGRCEAGAKWEELCRYLDIYASSPDFLRILPIVGDVGRTSLGLSPPDAEWLRCRVTHVIHAAATIHLNQPLETARATNVRGTREVLSFAESCPRLERFAHVSTAYVAGDRNGTIREDELYVGQRFLNTYEQSKSEAEALIQALTPRVPVSIFRPGIIVGDSSDGHTSNFGTLYCPLELIARGVLSKIPGEPSTPLDIAPVDYVADCIVRLVGDHKLSSATYHVTAGPGHAITVGELVDTMARFAGVTPPRFVAHRDSNGAAHGRLGSFFAYLSGCKAFSDATLRRDLGVTESPCPRPSDYIHNLYSFCESADWGRDLPWQRAALRMAA